MRAGVLLFLCIVHYVSAYAPFIIDVDDYQVELPPPPPHDEVAKMARYIVHVADWAAIATISSQKDIKGLPFAGVMSISDGPDRNSTGVPYMYMTSMDVTSEDLKENPYASLTMTLAEGSFCKSHNYDAEDPRCARVMLNGRIDEVPRGSAEEAFARAALFSRHPVMAHWPKSHHWFFAKLTIKSVRLFDYFGGIALVPLKDYFAARTSV